MMTAALLRHWNSDRDIVLPRDPIFGQMPFHSASAFRIGIKPTVRFASAGFGGLNFDRLLGYWAV